MIPLPFRVWLTVVPSSMSCHEPNGERTVYSTTTNNEWLHIHWGRSSVIARSRLYIGASLKPRKETEMMMKEGNCDCDDEMNPRFRSVYETTLHRDEFGELHFHCDVVASSKMPKFSVPLRSKLQNYVNTFESDVFCTDGIINGLMKPSLVPKHTRTHLYKTLARPVLCYGSEVCTLRKSNENRITVLPVKLSLCAEQQDTLNDIKEMKTSYKNWE
ncbi:hypothetical protein ANN_23365 [Periplaneta americana]|uniref:Uncharacterized protein n=1 Tax=Periplaneta americana TaxID=6978 RepID=A0ABQ8SLT0_PERAM|nr:hypothetical protein ANN_23365 [Periplaneta americana]